LLFFRNFQLPVEVQTSETKKKEKKTKETKKMKRFVTQRANGTNDTFASK
jgi:hypothetical protein